MTHRTLAGFGLAMILSLSFLAVGQDQAPPAPQTPAPAPAPPPAPAPDAPRFTTLKEKVSYIFGLNVGTSLKRDNINSVDVDMLARGVRDVLEGRQSALSPDEIRETIMAYSEQIKQEGLERNKQFFEANKLREGVKTTPSGLQYEVLAEGEGDSPGPKDIFVAHYRGALIDGREFDNSYRIGTPLEYPVENMIRGWVEALQKMKRGSKWRLFVPPDLAYGENPPEGTVIPPNAILVFEMELLDFKKAPAEGATPPPANPQP